jgi:hypothetical protein
MTRTTCVSALVAFTFVLFAGCAARVPAQLPSVAAAGCPVILLTRTAGLGFESQAGVLAAVWPSGTLLRSESAAMVGPNHFVGRVGAADLAALEELVQAANAAHQPAGEAVLDSPRDFLTFRQGSDVRQWRETPGFTTNPVLTEFRSKLFSLPVERAVRIDEPLDEIMRCATPGPSNE